MSSHTYSCSIPGCGATYRRKEHLNRHSAQSHRDGNRFSCPHCPSTLARTDLLRRHIKTYHQQYELPQFRAQKACSACRARKERCKGKFPCSPCERRGLSCTLLPEPSTQHLTEMNTQRPAGDSNLPTLPGPPLMDTNPTHIAMDLDIGATSTTATRFATQDYINIYFRDFHPHWPFLHPSTFDVSREPSILVQSVLMIGMWVTGHPSKRDAALELHNKLSDAVRMQAGSWSISTSGSDKSSPAPWPMATYQSTLLQIIMALLLAKERTAADLSLRHQLNPDDSHLLITLVRTCRLSGMFYYPNMVAQHSPTAPLAMIWVNVEEIKRFGLSLYKVCRISSLTGSAEMNASIRKELLGLADLDFCMPDSDRFWGAPAVMDGEDRRRMISQTSLRENTDQGTWVSNAARALCDAQVDFEWI